MARPIKALIIDDSYTTRQLVMKALDQTGLADFSFTEADDGVDALGKFEPDATDIIFVDMNMPRMDGIEFVRELNTRHKKCPPAVIVTGESSKERLIEALNEPGVAAFLLKPVDRDRLRSGLQKIIDSIPVRAGVCLVPHGECVPQAMRDIVATLAKIELTRVSSEDAAAPGTIVLGLVSIQGAVQWSVVLGFSQQAACAVASRFAGRDIPLGDPDLGDAIGEITNMVGGRIKNLLNPKGLKVEMSLPTVIRAADFRILVQRKATADHAHFDSPVGRLWSTVTVGINPGLFL